MALVLTADANPGTASWSTALSETATVAVVADPGNNAVIPVDQSADISLIIGPGVAETNTVAAPTFAGQELLLAAGLVGMAGTRAVTFASPFNLIPNSTITFAAPGECAMLKSFLVGASLVWKLVFVQGATLS